MSSLPSDPDVSSPLLVFLHGWGSSPGFYANSLRSAAHQVDVFAPAIPGHGGLPLPARKNRTLEQVSAGLLPEVSARGAGRHVILAGHSLGGALATLLCADLAEAHGDVSLLLLSPAGASPSFGPREWIRAFGDLRQPRPPRARTLRESRYLLTTSLRTSRLGWQARVADLTQAWTDLLEAGVAVTAVHAVHDKVVQTEPLSRLEGAQIISVPRPHDWPVWDTQSFSLAVQVHLERLTPSDSSLRIAAY